MNDKTSSLFLFLEMIFLLITFCLTSDMTKWKCLNRIRQKRYSLHFLHEPSHYLTPPLRRTLTSSSPFSAESWSGVPPQLSVTISPPCSSSQLSTLAWPRLAAKCIAVAPSPSLSARPIFVKLIWRGEKNRGVVELVERVNPSLLKCKIFLMLYR